LLNLIPTATELEDIKAIFEVLKTFESISKALQTQGIKLFEGHALLDQLRIDCDKDLVRVA
jgi:hypothetical protein